MTLGTSGVQIQLLLGPVPRPAPVEISNAVERIEVTESTDGATGFQLSIGAGLGTNSVSGDTLIGTTVLRPLSRVIVTVRIGGNPIVLVDGVITHRQLVCDDEGVVAVTGEDLTVLMDLEERITAHPAMSDAMVAAKLLERYVQYGVLPRVVPTTFTDQPLPTERVPVQHGSDLAHLRLIATRANHVFALLPGPSPVTNVAYWGPAERLGGRPLPPLSATGADIGVSSVRFEHDSLATAGVTGRVADAASGQSLPIVALPVPISALASQPGPARRRWLPDPGGGLTAAAARARSQARADASGDSAVVAFGNVDVVRYGSVLRAYRLVGMRGAGRSFDGLYRVESVTHVLERGSYTQQFRLGRPGVGTTTAILPDPVQVGG